MRTLLIVTRQPSMAKAIETVLDLSQFQLIVKEDVADAEFLLVRGAIDGAILELELTETRALRAIAEIKGFAPGCPVIVYTGNKQWEWEEDAYLHVLQAVQIRVLFPFPLFVSSVHDHRASRREAFDFRDRPQGACLRELQLEDRPIDSSPHQEKFGVRHVLLHDELKLAKVEHGLDSLGHGGLAGHDEEGTHLVRRRWVRR